MAQRSFVHPTALLETEEVGEGTSIWAYAHLMRGAKVGANCNIGDHCFIESGAVIGNNVTVKNGNMIWDGVTILDGVFVGPGVFLTNDLYPRSPRLAQVRERYRGRGWLVPTLVKEGASLGAGAVIRAGITIHEFALVGAGAVVTKDVPPYSLVVGNPARRRGWVCQCGLPLRFEDGGATCRECGRRFAQQGDVVTHVPAQEPAE